MSVHVLTRVSAPEREPHHVSLRASDADDRFSGSIAAAVQRLLASPPPQRAPRPAGTELTGSPTTPDETATEDASPTGTETHGTTRDASGVFGVLVSHEEPGAALETLAKVASAAEGELALPKFSRPAAPAPIAMPAPIPAVAMQALATLAASLSAPTSAATKSPSKTLSGFAPPPSTSASRAKTRDHAEPDEPSSTPRAHRVEASPAPARHVTHHAASPEARTTTITATMGAVRTIAEVRTLPVAATTVTRAAPAPIAEPEPSLPEPPASAVHYGAIESDDAHIELAHPTLGRLDLDVHHDAGRYDVSLVTRSMGASIALRAAEESLRVDMRARSTELRAYRVRTEASRNGPRATNDDEEMP